jgi:hypothetical protein
MVGIRCLVVEKWTNRGGNRVVTTEEEKRRQGKGKVGKKDFYVVFKHSSGGQSRCR